MMILCFIYQGYNKKCTWPDSGKKKSFLFAGRTLICYLKDMGNFHGEASVNQNKRRRKGSIYLFMFLSIGILSCIYYWSVSQISPQGHKSFILLHCNRCMYDHRITADHRSMISYHALSLYSSAQWFCHVTPSDWAFKWWIRGRSDISRSAINSGDLSDVRGGLNRA